METTLYIIKILPLFLLAFFFPQNPTFVPKPLFSVQSLIPYQNNRLSWERILFSRFRKRNAKSTGKLIASLSKTVTTHQTDYVLHPDYENIPSG